MNSKVLHYPRLDTVLNVEKVIREADIPLSKNEIDYGRIYEMFLREFRDGKMGRLSLEKPN